MIKLPGLIDSHTHPRGLPTDDYKETFLTATAAALAGGFTTIFDMPNNPKTPTLTNELLAEKQSIASKQIVCDVGFFFGTNGQNFKEFAQAAEKSKGLKVFLSQSTGNLLVNLESFAQICEQWTANLPILLHVEEDLVLPALEIAKQANKQIHVSHVSSEKELRQVFIAKAKGYNVTCGVTPHHLYLTQADAVKLGSLGNVKPSLKTKKDVDFLWSNLKDIDVIESDHAPHTLEEKTSSNPPFGFPGLETTLPLLLTSVSQDKLTIADIKRLCHDSPAKIFNVATDPQTAIEIDENEEWTIENDQLFTKCQWSPFAGWKVKGKVKRVFIRGTKVFEDGKILAKPGFGKIINYEN
ncbi:MAG TPA: amidohydrolase family protein [Patescibacteria group bacterium]